MKKILIVGSSLKDRGGIVTVINNTLNSHLTEEFNFKMIETYITGGVWTRILLYLQGVMKIIFEILRDRPDVIHIHMSYKGSFYRKSLIILLAHLFRVPTVVHVHGSSFKDFYFKLTKLQKQYCHYILNKPGRLIVLSQEWFDFFSSFVNKERLSILYNGVNEVSCTVERDNAYPVCLFMGRLGKRKGTYDLLESIKDIKDKNLNVKFLLAGDGEIENVSKRIKELDIADYVELLGWIDDRKKEELLRNSDILVLPSYNEGLPMALLEAMSYGLPVISTPVGGIPELVEHNKNGFLVDPGDVKSLTFFLQKLVTDKSIRNEIGLNNQLTIRQRFNLKELMKNLSTIYNEL